MTLQTKRVICLTTLIASLLTIIGTISYAYFSAAGTTREQTSTISTATVRATFADYGQEVGGSLNFGESVTKKFTIENTGSVEAHVKMYWLDLIDTYTNGSLTYTLSYSENETGTYTEIVSKKNIPQSRVASKEVLAESLTVPVGKTYYYNLVITLNYLNDVDQNADFNASFNTKFALEDISHEEPQPLIEKVMNKANDASITSYTDGATKEMYVFDHSGVQTQNTYNGSSLKLHPTKLADEETEENVDYRYIGANPNNYIEFNDEVWRIIGLFTVETESGEKERLIKIIRDQSIGYLPWDSYGSNEWSTSTLKTFLNGDYFNTGTSFEHTYKDTDAYGTPRTITIQKGLDEKARKQVASVKWYLGGSNTYKNLEAQDYYAFERKTESFLGHATNIIQKVGLMYPSDYVYTFANGVDNVCYNNNYNCTTQNGGVPSNSWLFHYNGSCALNITDSGVFFLDSSGNMQSFPVVKFNVQPTVYLTTDVQIEGNGSKENPYTIID